MKIAPFLASLLLSLSLLPSCQQTGTVNEEMILETLNCPRIAVTPHQPAWVSEQSDFHLLSAADLQKVRSLLKTADMRFVADKYYRDEEDGNRGDSSSELFYLYGDNAQCLGGRVINGQVYMDDLELEEPQRIELYTLLKPYLQKLPRDNAQ
ncbi:MAG: hypothetical protein IJ498_04055 [Akkermansia sp.]|nr:hypothetical protein [Akkermansia sp.]